MSSFDDEFGLFGENGEEDERRSTLGARRIATGETVIDDVEPEDERPKRRGAPSSERYAGTGGRYGQRAPGGAGGRYARKNNRGPADPVAAQQRAADLLEFLAKKLVAKPEAVVIESYPPDGPDEAVLELLVDGEDLGKVIGRNGRVAQALRTIVRAAAEGKIAVDIYDLDEANEGAEDPDEGE